MKKTVPTRVAASDRISRGGFSLRHRASEQTKLQTDNRVHCAPPTIGTKEPRAHLPQEGPPCRVPRATDPPGRRQLLGKEFLLFSALSSDQTLRTTASPRAASPAGLECTFFQDQVFKWGFLQGTIAQGLSGHNQSSAGGPALTQPPTPG